MTDLGQLERLIVLAAARQGSELNAAALGREVGVTQPTARAWLDVPQASFLVRLVPPYFRSIGKRIVKSPKLHFLDSGLVCALTRQPSAQAALAGGMGGAIFEGFIVAKAAKVMAAAGLEQELYHFRTHDGLGVDLIVRVGGVLVPVEVKLTATPTHLHATALTRFCSVAAPEAAASGLLVCRVPEPIALPGDHTAMPWQRFTHWLCESHLGDTAAESRHSLTAEATPQPRAGP